MSQRTDLALALTALGLFSVWLLGSMTLFPFGKPSLGQTCTTFTQTTDETGAVLMACDAPITVCRAYTKTYPHWFCPTTGTPS